MSTPPSIAILAASSFVDMPPVPHWEPAPPAASQRAGVISVTRSISLAFGFCCGVVVVQAVDIGQEDQQVGAAEHGNDGGERIVVAQNLMLPRFDFRVGDRVVFVDHGHHAHPEQSRKGAAQIVRPVRVLHVFPR